MNKEKFNTAIEASRLAYEQLNKAMNKSIETKQISDLPERIVIDYAFMTSTLLCLETLLRAEMERDENNEN